MDDLNTNGMKSMLGKIVEIKLDYTQKSYVSKVGDSIYCGYTYDNLNAKIPVYFFSKKEPDSHFLGNVIGVLNNEIPTQKKIIAAPKGFIYYEPEIKAMLSRINHQQIHSLSCRYEKSCGAIILNQNLDNTKILIVKNKNANNWGFPKGHVEKDETEYQTALREVYEETGLEINIIDGFREVSDYYSFGNSKKRVIFFLATTDDISVTLQIEELDAFKWVTFEEALKIFQFKNNMNLLNKAKQFINQNQIPLSVY